MVDKAVGAASRWRQIGHLCIAQACRCCEYEKRQQQQQQPVASFGMEVATSTGPLVLKAGVAHIGDIVFSLAIFSAVITCSLKKIFGDLVCFVLFLSLSLSRKAVITVIIVMSAVLACAATAKSGNQQGDHHSLKLR